ncbi:feruloyl-CoA synthase [Rhodobacter sp. NTK016B]|uniref:feruloyl-CoA synthase n=1 Tax=Rhodobacter sp. NTK016B TaxID=2759676 RepID=UPI001A8DD913|nr:feruloyl-CoA synthase [Rhodobacter sp. NTK016B]MBN8292035.1 feruloyl-CoA synthase [Rhodobacter sp. NTK016B]
MTQETQGGKYRAHNARREDLADGTILLTSGLSLGPVARCATDWLVDWAARVPGRTFVAERSGPGWREVSYAQALDMVRAIAAALAERGLNAETPILIVSGNGVDHALLTLAAQYIGVPTVPVAEQYALIEGAHPVLERIAGMIRPAMVFADDAARYGKALSLPVFDGVEKVVSQSAGDGMTDFAALLKGQGDVSALNAKVGPDTVAKYLLTSGSTSHPKGVLTTQRMMTTNQAQLKECLPFVAEKPLVLLDWLPWNHVFGGSHNFNLVLSNGGTLYVDNGKPTPALAHHTIENLRMVSPTIAFNVPVGFGVLRDAMKNDDALKQQYFRNLDMLFYAGASLPQDIWADLEAIAHEVRGDMPLFNSSWGLTETAPAALIQHEFTDQSGIIGVPLPGVTIKLVPADDDNRFEVRVKGDTITPGYLHDPEKTAEAFDDEGYFITGDAMKFVDPADMNKGMKFDGRIAEEFKLNTGTWVRAAGLRLEILGKLKGLAADVVLTGADRAEIGVMIVPTDALRAGAMDHDGALAVTQAAEIAERLKPAPNEGSAHAVRRVQVLAEPPSMAEGEITAKGNLNFRKILMTRKALLDRLYDDSDPATIKV